MMAKMKPPTIVAISGSNREGSLNTKLRDAAAAMLEADGAIVQRVNLEELNLPLVCLVTPNSYS